MKKLFIIPMLVVLAAGCSSSKQAAAPGSVISNQAVTQAGIVEGTVEASGVVAYKGIPYAAPPVGNLRWKAPQPAASWTGVKETKAFGPRAVQAPIFGDMGFRSNGMSEDCLYLNVWTKAKQRDAKLPVLVYFYGGGFVAGDGSEARYDGESMAERDIVAVTVNYRLGAFGFMAHPELTAESPNKASGNYGVLDQAAALKWVHDNIAAFGGDPAKITIAGESAGSVSVSAQMASPLSKNLIAGAIGESGSFLGALSPVTLADGEKVGLAFGERLQAPTLAALRALPADSILAASNRFGPFRFSMTIDGYFLPKAPVEIWRAGEQAQVPLLAGWNSEEMNYRMVMGSGALTKAAYEEAVRKLYNDKADQVLAAYAPASDADVEQVATELAGDRFISFSTWRWIDLQSKNSRQPVYRYYYTRPRPEMTPEMGNASPGLAGGVQKNDGPKPPPAKGAVHSAEIEYAMGNLRHNKVYAWKKEDYEVSRIMQAYFANFIKTGNPNGEGLPQWPAVNSNAPHPVMYIDANTKLVTDPFSQRYALMESLIAQ